MEKSKKAKQFEKVAMIITIISVLPLIGMSLYVSSLFVSNEVVANNLPFIEQIFYPYLAVWGILMLIIFVLTPKELIIE